MTLEEYEKVLEEKRKALQALKTEKRKVDLDKDFESMKQLSSKKGNDDVFIKLGSEKDKRKEAADKEDKAKKEALYHLASIDLIELCNEAKIERCRATRDLRSCGRYVHCVLNSCGHASLCAECSQRCDLCPICRMPIPKSVNPLRLRLYYECIEAGLISKRYDDRFHEKEDGENQLTADVERLYSLFDVALENNLVSLICHYNLEVEEMKTRLSLLLKFSMHLSGISNVLEALESSFKETISAQLHDLHHLQDSVLKSKQHLEIMAWCIRHHFLENLRSRYADFALWCSVVSERKSAAVKRSWPHLIHTSVEFERKEGSTLFIEDALSNLEIEQGCAQEMGEESEIISLQKVVGSPSFYRSKNEGLVGCYPFENVRAAADVLFLHRSSDLVVAKRAIFLYYLFDRYWTMPDENWRGIVDDFAATFGITRHSLLESLTFYLLDDHTDHALQEACRLLPEIAGPTTHPKIAHVLLERQNPDAALMVLRWSGRDGLCGYANNEHGGVQLVSLAEAVTAVRVRVECGLLTEAFMYQRMHWIKLEEEKLKQGSSRAFSNDAKNKTWMDQMELLVTEICCLCIRRNLVDRMIELPWNSYEEKYLHKCLLDHAKEDPSTTSGSLLVVFYLQRYRYIEAYQVDCELKNLEDDFISKASISEEVSSRISLTRHWRSGLVEKCIELLPDIQRQQVKTGNLPESTVSSVNEVRAKYDLSSRQQNSSSLLAPSSASSSLLLQMDHTNSEKVSAFDTPEKAGVYVSNSPSDLLKYCSPSILHRSLRPVGGSSNLQARDSLASSQYSLRGLRPQTGIRKTFKFDGTPSPGIHIPSPWGGIPLKEVNRTSSRTLQNNHFQDGIFDGILPTIEWNGSMCQEESNHPYKADPVNTPSRKNGQPKDSAQCQYPNLFTIPSDRPWAEISSDNPMDISCSYKSEDSEIKDINMNGGPRWRSDETSKDEEESSAQKIVGSFSFIASGRGTRRSRFATS